MPSLIFLPGVGADPNFWRPVGERLPAAWRKTYLGWPGLGDQPADPAINRFEDLAGLVEAELGDEPADLIAQSMGGALAMMVALRHPSRVRRLMLTVTSGGLDMTGLGAADWRSNYRRLHPDGAAWVTDARPDLADDLARVKQPALLIWGDADPISPVADGAHDLALTRSDEVAPLIKAHLS
jgi:pimeloyl-ACP methyl ester carboxylesterase